MSGDSLDVHIGSGLIKHKYRVLPEQGPCQTHQLPLTNAEVGPSLCDLAMQLPFQLLYNQLQLNLEKGIQVNDYTVINKLLQPILYPVLHAPLVLPTKIFTSFIHSSCPHTLTPFSSFPTVPTCPDLLKDVP